MHTRYRTLVLAIFGLALAGAASIAQARDRHVDFSINLPHLAISSQHGYAGYPYYDPHYDPPHVSGHYHGRQLCHLSHVRRHHYGHGGHPHYDQYQRHHDRRHDRHHYDH